ncbi:UDP-N-acetylmuramate--L-alanine ligase [Patescibacteria group bacterium]|nr:UDP-N-acetylmuramate--L-alanine ligase [Patescibacteria group bacterium]
MKHLYLIGVGGVGMAWVADYALRQGWRVSGSDITETALTRRLQGAGAQIYYGSDPTRIPADITEVVINSAITPSSPSYPEVAEAERRGLKIEKRAEWVGKITRQKFTIAVAGTHGKTTTTAMIGWILEKAGLDPTVFVGGQLAEWGNATRIGSGEYLVVEADEFDRSFHRFYPKIAVVLNIDPDHLDYYPGGITEIEHAFKRFLRNLPARTGLVVGYGKDSHIRKIARGFSYKFRWYDESRVWPGLTLRIPGRHNLLNATTAARVAHELGVPQKSIKEALATFPGVGRRFEYLGTWNRVELYDDYGHHPREVAATLQAAAEKFSGQRLTVVFQPHQKARTFHLLKEFGRCFDQHPPDELILAPIYQVAGREEGIAVSSGDIATEIAKNRPAGMVVTVVADNRELKQVVRAASHQSGNLLIMGAGDIRALVDGWRKE